MHSSESAKTGVGVSEAEVMAILAELLCEDLESLDPRTDFASMGVDSVLSVEFADRLRTRLGVQVRAGELYEYGTPVGLVAALAA